MATTHYFPTDQVHFTWDTGNEPVLTVADGDTVVFETRDVSDNQIGPDSDTSVIAGLDWDRVYPLAGPVATSRAPSRATRSRSRSSTSTPRAGAGRRSCPASGCWPTTSPSPTCASSTSRAATVTYFRDDIVIPLTPFIGTMGVCPAGASAQPVMPPGTFGGNLDTRQLVAGHDAVPAGPRSRARCSATGDAHGCQGDGEICVTGLEAPMYATHALQRREALDPVAAVPHRARLADPARRPRRLLRDDRRRRRPLRERAERDARR